MRHHTGISSEKDAAKAVLAACGGADASPTLVLYFSDSERFHEITRILADKYPSCPLVGSTTHTSLSKDSFGGNALAVLTLYDDTGCSVGIFEDVSRCPSKHAGNARKCLEALGHGNITCIEFTTPSGDCEELVLDAFREALGDDIPVFGGSAGAETQSEALVALNGTVYGEACVFAIVKTEKPVRFYRENIFRPMGMLFSATDVDCEKRTVYEFDERPAASVIAKLLGTDQKDLSELLQYHPIGRVIGSEIYVAEPREVTMDGAISYYAKIYNHTRLTLLEEDDVERVFRETREKLISENPNRSLCLIVNCMARTKLLEKRGKLKMLAESVAEFGDHIGMTGFGEQLDHRHFNQTMIVAVFE